MDYFGVKWDRAFATFAVVTKKKRISKPFMEVHLIETEKDILLNDCLDSYDRKNII